MQASAKSSEYLESIVKETGAEVLKSSKKRVVLKVDASRLKQAVKLLVDKYGDVHISAITGTDFGEEIEVAYHFWIYKEKVLLVIKTRVPKSNPQLPTICDIIPGALFHENEVYDLLGVVFEGHPKLRKNFILPEDSPLDYFPLRRS